MNAWKEFINNIPKSDRDTIIFEYKDYLTTCKVSDGLLKTHYINFCKCWLRNIPDDEDFLFMGRNEHVVHMFAALILYEIDDFDFNLKGLK